MNSYAIYKITTSQKRGKKCKGPLANGSFKKHFARAHTLHGSYSITANPPTSDKDLEQVVQQRYRETASKKQKQNKKNRSNAFITNMSVI